MDGGILQPVHLSLMDHPQASTFPPPKEDVFAIHSEMAHVQHIISNHNDRLARLEQRQFEDVRSKSIWGGSSSPFPGVLGGTPQQGPIAHPSGDDTFSGFDDQSSHLIGSLHLDAEEEPRRVGATSRANSVRFDETANQGHWSHPNRSSLDLFPRSGSSLSLHPMMERTYSHKSDGRQSSTGQSIHSAASRANSLGIDTINGLGNGVDLPSFSPGLLHIGSCPAIIRCWLTTRFKNDTLMYAAVCSGSSTSVIDRRLIESLNKSDEVRIDDEGVSRIKINVYLPEAVVKSASFRSASPTSQLPAILVEFTVVENEADDKTIAVVIGSDTLKTHNADILFSSNRMVLFDDDQTKVSVPLVRPENSSTYELLQTRGISSMSSEPSKSQQMNRPPPASEDSEPVSKEQAVPDSPLSRTMSKQDLAVSPGTPTSRESHALYTADMSNITEPSLSDSTNQPSNRQQPTSPAFWGNWRQNQEKQTQDWNKPGTTGGSYQRKEQSIKVFKPGQKGSGGGSSGTRTFSSSMSDGTGSKRDEHVSQDASKAKVGVRSNPVGEGSAFSWLAK
jgi:ubiquitin carboxyl-terminal hydrolase 4/11/15